MARPRKQFWWLLAIVGGVWLWRNRAAPVVAPMMPAAANPDTSVSPTAAATTANMQALALAGRDWVNYPVPVTRVG